MLVLNERGALNIIRKNIIKHNSHAYAGRN